MTLKELEEFCNGLGFDGKIRQNIFIRKNTLYCDLGHDYYGPTIIYFPGDGGYVYVAKDMTMKLSKDKQHKYLYEINGDGDGVFYHQYKIKDTEAVQKAIYALKHEWKECLTKIRIIKAINDFR